jgi:hypothetical protein
MDDYKFDEEKEFAIWKERSIHGLTLTWEEYRVVRKEALNNRKKRMYMQQNKKTPATKPRTKKKKRTTKHQKGSTVKNSEDGVTPEEEEGDKNQGWSFMKWNKTAEKFSKQWRPFY